MLPGARPGSEVGPSYPGRGGFTLSRRQHSSWPHLFYLIEIALAFAVNPVWSKLFSAGGVSVTAAQIAATVSPWRLALAGEVLTYSATQRLPRCSMHCSGRSTRYWHYFRLSSCWPTPRLARRVLSDESRPCSC